MAFDFKIFVIAGLSVAVLGACSPSARFADMAASFGASAPTPDVAELETVPESDDDDVVVPVLAYAASTAEKPLAVQPGRAEINRLISQYARTYNVPESLVHKVVNRESTYKPNARNGIHIGLMQLNPTTARTMGFRGSVGELYYPENNLKYGIKYLAGAYLVADGNAVRADKLYQTGYYYHAKRKGLLQATGLRP